MSWQKQKPKKTESSGLGTAVAVGAAAVSVAALAWGAKKLYEFVSEKNTPAAHGPAPSSSSFSAPPSPASQPNSFSRFSSEEHEANFRSGSTVKARKPSPVTPTSPEICAGWDQESTSTSSTDGSSFCIIEDEDVTPSIVQNEMVDYYDNYVHLPKRVGRKAMLVATNVIKIIQNHLEAHCPGLTDELIGTGSAFDGTQVIAAENFDVLIPVRMPEEDESSQWTSISGRESLGWDSASGYSLVLSDNLEETAAHHYKLIIENQFLSPMKARIFFRELIQNAVKEYPETAPYKITVSSVGSATSVNVLYDEECRLHIHFMPAVKLGSRLLTANPYPRCEQEHDCEEGYRKLWQECYALQEAEKLSSMSMHEMCHIRCLKIMKAIILNDNLHLGKLSSYHCKTLLFYLMDKESNWDCSKLGERVSDMLNMLDFYLRERRLPHYYLPEINLFEEFGRHELDDLKNYITSVLRKGSISALLKRGR